MMKIRAISRKGKQQQPWIVHKMFMTAFVWFAVGVLGTLLLMQHPLFLQPSTEYTLQPHRSQFYVVQPGDTISAIAARFGSSSAAILAANDIADPAALQPGKEIKIPYQHEPLQPRLTVAESFAALQPVADTTPRSMADVVTYDEQPVIDVPAIRSIAAYWYGQFAAGGPRHDEFLSAYQAMAPLADEFAAIFEAEGVPVCFFWLALPESFWRGETSSQGAAGYWQLMPDTARELGLAVDGGIDERLVPRQCARAAARYLRQLYDEFGNWSLVLNRYNGGFAGRYVAQEYVEVSYERFLAFMDAEISDIRASIRSKPYILHTIAPGETISSLRGRYGLHKGQVITRPDGRRPDPQRLRPGDTLCIPLLPAQQHAAFERATAGYIENLEYPAKFVAVLWLVRERNAQQATMLAQN